MERKGGGRHKNVEVIRFSSASDFKSHQSSVASNYAPCYRLVWALTAQGMLCYWVAAEGLPCSLCPRVEHSYCLRLGRWPETAALERCEVPPVTLQAVWIPELFHCWPFCQKHPTSVPFFRCLFFCPFFKMQSTWSHIRTLIPTFSCAEFAMQSRDNLGIH